MYLIIVKLHPFLKAIRKLAGFTALCINLADPGINRKIRLDSLVT